MRFNLQFAARRLFQRWYHRLVDGIANRHSEATDGSEFQNFFCIGAFGRNITAAAAVIIRNNDIFVILMLSLATQHNGGRVGIIIITAMDRAEVTDVSNGEDSCQRPGRMLLMEGTGKSSVQCPSH